MRPVELYMDSYLSQFDLFVVTDKILRAYNEANPLEEEMSYAERKARDIFYKWLDLASLLDTFDDWGETEWQNFFICMRLAYLNKGTGIALAWVIAAMGCILTEDDPITIERVLIEDEYVTVVNLDIAKFYGTLIDQFLAVLDGLIPELLWVDSTSETTGQAVDAITYETVQGDAYISATASMYVITKVTTNT